MERTQLT